MPVGRVVALEQGGAFPWGIPAGAGRWALGAGALGFLPRSQGDQVSSLPASVRGDEMSKSMKQSLKIVKLSL